MGPLGAEWALDESGKHLLTNIVWIIYFLYKLPTAYHSYDRARPLDYSVQKNNTQDMLSSRSSTPRPRQVGINETSLMDYSKDPPTSSDASWTTMTGQPLLNIITPSPPHMDSLSHRCTR
ncbi:hypothetical protein AG1IA_01997 [Rhizoctonia solani AG-1 IA]|uniref:Uncharacterized protein n=1 Tax=Thanatephorus cucumeris (strain AG1-IA) TaxID=983506 RepID=L8X0X2_THACA|nr:hypothetical protein AG1IA_01997 [Rhizoctonia solani AG-1 IA]